MSQSHAEMDREEAIPEGSLRDDDDHIASLNIFASDSCILPQITSDENGVRSLLLSCAKYASVSLIVINTS